MGWYDRAAVAEAIGINHMFSHYILIALGAPVASLFVYRILNRSVQYIRTLTCLNNANQQSFKMPNPGLVGSPRPLPKPPSPYSSVARRLQRTSVPQSAQ